MFVRLCFVLTCLPVMLWANKFEVAFEWKYINFTWPSEEAMANYVPGEDVIAGIKIYKNVIYLALPRIRTSSRVTLASVPIDANKENPLLSPYPSWEMNSGSTCDAIQNVLSMEIDKDGIMWVLDARRVDNNTDCPPRILLLNLNSKGKIVEDFKVSPQLCPSGCFLNDIVVDGDFAYISDTTQTDPGILVFNKKTKKAWKARDSTMRGDPSAVHFTAQGVMNKGLSHVNGIALCCPATHGRRTLFFMPQTSLHIFSISNHILKNRTLSTAPDLHNSIADRGTKRGQSGGMICDNSGHIYYGLMPRDSVAKWDITKPLAAAEIVEENHEIIRWPDSFSIYKENLYLITNSISKFSQVGIDTKEINFRILKLRTNTKSYIYC